MLCVMYLLVLVVLFGVKIFEVGDWGMWLVEWGDFEIVNYWCFFFD